MTPMTLGLGLAGSALQGILGNRAARDQRRAARQQQALFAQQAAQNRADFQPFMGLGQNALARMAAVDGGDFSAFENAPDFVFARDQGMQALDRSAAARGSLFAGGTDADRMQFASGLASQNLQNFLGRMMGQAQMGQQATGALGDLNLRVLGGQAGAIGAQGAARAAGRQAWSNMLGDMAGLGGDFLGARQPLGGGVWGQGTMPVVPVTPLTRMTLPIPRGG